MHQPNYFGNFYLRRPLLALATFSGLAFAFVAADVAHDSDWYWAAILEFEMLFYASVVALVLGALQTRPVRLLALPPWRMSGRSATACTWCMCQCSYSSVKCCMELPR